MGKHIFVDGGLYVSKGCLYSRDVSAGGSWHPEDAEIISPLGGVWEITTDTGSIFSSYYVREFVSCGGGEYGDIVAYADIYKFTIDQYEKGLEQIKRMLESVPGGEQGVLYCQQQFASVFSLMEQFLSCTFVRQTCDREESYHQVLESGLLQQKFGNKQILNGPDCLEKELKYIELVNNVVYHNQKAVRRLFDSAFGICVDLCPLEDLLEKRNDIIHRFGHEKKGGDLRLAPDDVRDLIVKVDNIVNETARQMLALPPSERMYPEVHTDN